LKAEAERDRLEIDARGWEDRADRLETECDQLRFELEEANRMRDWHSDCADSIQEENNRLRSAIEAQLARMAEDRPDWADMQILRDAL
jgi:chromosome segregation ATPase